MKNKDLIEKLQALPSDAEVRVFDWKKNTHHADADPTSEGIHDFEVRHETEDVTIPFIAISFENDDYDENGDLLIV